MRAAGILLCVTLMPLGAQTALRRSIRAAGEGSVSVRPDAARVTVSVIKQATTAADAASQNATAAAGVIEAIRQLLGATAEVKTVSYSLLPLYNSPRDGSQPQIVGFSAQNTIQAVAGDPSGAGRVIDAALAAGATRVDGLQLFLRSDEASRAQALRSASQLARTRAEAIAMGLGVRLGPVLSAQEGYAAIPAVGELNRLAPGATAALTPVEPGTLEVRANVMVEIEIAP